MSRESNSPQQATDRLRVSLEGRLDRIVAQLEAVGRKPGPVPAQLRQGRPGIVGGYEADVWARPDGAFDVVLRQGARFVALAEGSSPTPVVRTSEEPAVLVTVASGELMAELADAFEALASKLRAVAG